MRKSIIASVLALLATCLPSAATAQDRYERDLQPRVERFIREQRLPGFAIGVVENGRVVYARGFGVMRLGGTGEPVTERTLFHMASITKPFVATAVMQLADAGKVDLEAPVTRYIPYFRMRDERYKTITVRQMLNHTSGIPDVEDYEWEKPQYDEGALERYVRSLGRWKLDFAPGARFQYSNTAFEILGDLVAKVSGESFEAYVQHHILDPLGMKDSTLLIREANPKLLAWGHELDRKKQPVPSKVYPYNRMHTPSSDLHSNVADMARWAIANMNGGVLDGARILPASAYGPMWTPAVAAPGRKSAPGISWFIGEYRGHRRVGHGGGDTGFITQLAMLPEQKIAVIWMTNADWLTGDGGLTDAALDVALGVTP